MTLLGVVACRVASATVLLEERFDDVATLPAAGWVMLNRSLPAAGSTSWFQGRELILPAYEGPPDAYIAANFENAPASGIVDNWLISPPLYLTNGDELVFYTRQNASSLPDALEVRLSPNGVSTTVGGTSGVGDFTTLLATLNPGQVPFGYPQDWTAVTLPISGLPETRLCRIALRYRASGTSTRGDFIAIDSFAISTVPEPDRVAALALGGAFLAVLRLRRSRRAT